MSLSEYLRNKAKENPLRVFFVEDSDERVLKAINVIKDEKIAFPVIVSENENLNAEVLNPSVLKKEAVEIYSDIKKVNSEEAEKAVSNRLIFAMTMLRGGYADALISGSSYTTAEVLKAALSLRKFYPGMSPVSSCFFMEVSNKNLGENGIFVFSDCALNPEPSAKMLASIAGSAGKALKNILGITPKIAMLSYSTKGSGEGPSVNKVREAVEFARNKFTDLIIDGEMQADAAIIDWIGEKKAKGSSVAGHANVLIFPDLNSGNISYKLVERLCGARAVGPVLLGIDPVVNDLSRGCSVDDIIDLTAVSVIQANNLRKERL